MRTWKQGVIGKAILKNGETVFTKCLKYPLLAFYKGYDSKNSGLNEFRKLLFVDLDVLKQIEKIGLQKMNSDESRICQVFDVEYSDGTSRVDKVLPMDSIRGIDISRIIEIGIVTWEKLNEMTDMQDEECCVIY